MKSCTLQMLILFIGLSFVHCEGDSICSATVSPSTDADSDCVADSSDNCKFVYNPAQVDVDENEIGDACEPAPAAAFQAFMTLDTVQNPSSSPLDYQDCELSLITCTGESLNLEDQNLNWIVDETSPCSAFNTTASTPPELQCLRSNNDIETLGHVTLNTSFADALSPCDVFEYTLDLTKWCQ